MEEKEEVENHSVHLTELHVNEGVGRKRRTERDPASESSRELMFNLHYMCAY